MLVIRSTWDEYIDGKLTKVTCAKTGGQIGQPTQDNRRSESVQIFFPN
jgi:hypothetical protein